MISIQEATALIKNQEINDRFVTMSIEDSLQYHLGASVIAPFDQPLFDNAAMDGYVVNGEGLTFRIVGEIKTGQSSSFSIQKGEAIRIFTGAMIPQGTTAVVMQEQCKVLKNELHISEQVIAGKFIRKAGAEIRKGAVVFESGHLITPATIGVLASFGITQVKVFQKPKIALVATGNEIKFPDENLLEGQIYDASSASLQAVLSAFSFELFKKVKVKDQLETISDEIGSALEQSDVLLITGGISVGDYDFVKKALEQNDVDEVFHKVKQKPGKPLYFGRKDHKFVFGLPGNTASSLTCFYFYVLPLLQLISGSKEPGLRRIIAPLSHEYEMRFDRPTFLKALLEQDQVKILDGQDSSMIQSMARSNAFVFLDGMQLIQQGDPVVCFLH